MEENGAAMHYTDIAEKILSQELRDKIGATPAATVSYNLSTSINNDGSKPPFIRVGRGEYILKESTTPKKKFARTTRPTRNNDIETTEENIGVINAFGMYWQRDTVFWERTPKLLGRQQIGAESVDFCEQIGVYLLHDNSNVVYVGRATDRSLGKRMHEHTLDRLSGRWNRFSWFGLKGVTETGELTEPNKFPSTNQLINTMEALLIEGLEPPQNRRRGDDFGGVEYLQAEDPRIKTEQERTVVSKLLEKIK